MSVQALSGSPAPAKTEWPTVLVAVAIYGGWLLATYHHAALAWPVRLLIGGWLIAWHGSLQHEVIHGHPTPHARLNTLIGWVPLSIWLPFERYRAAHLAHHVAEQLTDPAHDPESRYLKPSAGLSGVVDGLFGRLQATLLGRLAVGPFVEVTRFLRREISAEDRHETASVWGQHALRVLAIVAWLKLVCGMSLADYLLTFVYPGAALTLIRSFAEHRAAPEPEHRVAVIERAPVFGLLFLNNNLHAVHHRHPGVAWHRLPAIYRRERAAVLQSNGGLVYRGYSDVFRRYLLRPHDVLVHPGLDAAAEPAG